jgi:hypothetical protein
MEEEARRILKEALGRPSAPGGLGSRLLARFAASATDEFVVPPRQAPREAPEWDSSE